jgi:hypothetical protein
MAGGTLTLADKKKLRNWVKQEQSHTFTTANEAAGKGFGGLAQKEAELRRQSSQANLKTDLQAKRAARATAEPSRDGGFAEFARNEQLMKQGLNDQIKHTNDARKKEQFIEQELNRVTNPDSLALGEANINSKLDNLTKTVQDLKKEEAVEKKAILEDESIIEQQQAQIKQEEDAQIKSKVRELKGKMKALRERIPGGTRLIIALCFALLFDGLDYFFGIGLIPVLGEVLDFVEMIIMSFLLGPAYGLLPGLVELSSLLEFVFPPMAFADWIPSFTISVAVFWWRSRKDRAELKEESAEEKDLEKSLNPAKGLFGLFGGGEHRELGPWSIIFLAIGAAIIYFFIGNWIMLVIYVGIIAIVLLGDLGWVWLIIMMGIAAIIYFIGAYPLLAGIILIVFLIMLIKRFGPAAFLGIIVVLILAIFYFHWNPYIYIRDNLSFDMQKWFAMSDVQTQKSNWVQKIRDNYYIALYKTLGYGYYEGEVEQNKKGDVGVYIKELNSKIYEPYNTETEINVLALIRGKTFKNSTIISTYCVLRNVTGKNQILARGVTNPSIIPIDIPDYYFFEDVTCTFPKMPKGSYVVDFYAKFDFETWAYAKYTFISKNLLISYYANQKDVNTELKIDKKATTIFTNGPVMIGMSSENFDMPIPVPDNWPDTETDLVLPGIFGVTVGSRQELATEGQIVRINRMEMLIPKGTTLINCIGNQSAMPDTPIAAEGPEAGKYWTYVVTNFEANKEIIANLMPGGTIDVPITDDQLVLNPVTIQGNLSFNSITCRLKVTENKPFNILGNEPKSVKSFVVMANYTYKLKKSVPIVVKDFNTYVDPNT